VVGGEDEDRVREPRLGPCPAEEIANRVVCMLHCAFAVCAGGNVDSIGGVSVRAVITGRHDVQEERFLTPVVAIGAIHFTNRQGEQILISYAPDVLVVNVLLRQSAAIEYARALPAAD